MLLVYLLSILGIYFLISKTIAAIKKIKDILYERTIFIELTNDILSKQIHFKDRVNHICRFVLPIHNTTNEALLGISLRDNYAFFIKDNRVIYSFQHYNDEIIKVLLSTFNTEINDVVNVNNDIYDKKTFERISFISPSGSHGFVNNNENTPEVKYSKQEQLNILLDKINQSGLNSLTEEERQLLKKLSN